MTRRGFTLTEMLMSLTVLGLMGIALTRILMSDTRFVSRQDAMLTARQGARAALNVLVPELSMVGDTMGVELATRDSVEVRTSAAFGVACRSASSSSMIAAMLPVDSVAWAMVDTTRFFWRQRSGYYKRLWGISMVNTTAAADSAKCFADSVRLIPGGKLKKITGIGGGEMPDSLALIMTYAIVKYKFAPSTYLPGRIGLWRQVSGFSAEELVAPFDTSARFAYLMGGPKAATLTLRTSSVTSSAGRDSIRGIELRLHAASEKSAQGTKKPEVFRLKARVRFANKVH